MESLVFDTSALLNFGHRGELTSVLEQLSADYALFTTPEAQAELTDPERKNFYASYLKGHFTVKAASSARFDLATIARLSSTIDAADITIMMLTHELGGTAVLDDKAARQQARLLGLRLTGTLGLLDVALRRHWLTDTECMGAVVKMADGKFFIPRPIPGQAFASYFANLE